MILTPLPPKQPGRQPKEPGGEGEEQVPVASTET